MRLQDIPHITSIMDGRDRKSGCVFEERYKKMLYVCVSNYHMSADNLQQVSSLCCFCSSPGWSPLLCVCLPTGDVVRF